MRCQVTKKHSTKAERIVAEALKDLHIPFKHRWMLNGREVDFIIGNVALELDGHEQDGEKNSMLAELGYIPIHLHNSEVTKESIIKLLSKLK